MARLIGLALVALLAGCGNADDNCQTTQCPTGSGSYRFCSGAGVNSCAFHASDGTTFTCNGCVDCQQAAAAVDSWCSNSMLPSTLPPLPHLPMPMSTASPDAGTPTTGTGSSSCDSCFSTAQDIGGACAKQAQACGADAACMTLNNCMSACTTQTCNDACAKAAPSSAVAETLAIYSCVCDLGCKSECTSFCAQYNSATAGSDGGAPMSSASDGGTAGGSTPGGGGSAPCGNGVGTASGTVDGMSVNVKSARGHVDTNGIVGVYMWSKAAPVGTVDPVEGDIMLSVGVRGTPPCETMYICSSDYSIPAYGVVAFWKFTSGAWQVASNAQLGSVTVAAKTLPAAGMCGGRFAGSFMALFSANQSLGGTFDAPIAAN